MEEGKSIPSAQLGTEPGRASSAGAVWVLRSVHVRRAERAELAAVPEQIHVGNVGRAPRKPGIAFDARLGLEVRHGVFQECLLLGGVLGAVASKLGKPKRLRETTL